MSMDKPLEDEHNGLNNHCVVHAESVITKNAHEGGNSDSRIVVLGCCGDAGNLVGN